MNDENMVTQSHFNMPEINMAFSQELHSLPASYGETSIFLMAVDPYSAHIIWEFGADDLSRMKQRGGRPVIRLHDITTNLSYTTIPRTSFEIKINIDDKKSYITLPEAGRVYSAELGFKNTAGRFFSLARSNSAEAPRDTAAAELYPDDKSADNAPGTPETAVPERQTPGDHIAATEVKTEELNLAVPPSGNRIQINGVTIDKYINAIEIINNPPPGLSFLPLEPEPFFSPLDYSSRHENPPRRTSHHRHSDDLTEFNEIRFISGISSR
ncbi:DUF4912 domain-containing protein [Desulfobacterota bacterium M19]